MTDVVITQAEFEALRALRQAATELVTGIPYVTMAGGNITRQNILVQALSTALEKTRDVDFENAKQLEGAANVATVDRKRTRTTSR